jgi:hypothetical protein
MRMRFERKRAQSLDWCDVRKEDGIGHEQSSRLISEKRVITERVYEYSTAEEYHLSI